MENHIGKSGLFFEQQKLLFDLRKVAPPPEESQSQTVDLAALIEQLQKSPELANTLASIIAGQKAC